MKKHQTLKVNVQNTGSVEPPNPSWRGFAIRAYYGFLIFRLVGMKKPRWRGFVIRVQVKHQRALQELISFNLSST